MKTRILLIDEDPSTLDSYKNAFAARSNQWEVEYHESADPALESIKQSPPKIVVCSYRLGDGNGLETLEAIEEINPEIQRFISASEEDKEKIESNLDRIYQFIPKSCSADKLFTELQHSLAIDNWLGNKRVKEIVSKMGEFPSLPPMYLKVMNALNNSSSSAEQIGQAISGDIAISAKILQVVNSSFYGLDDKTSDITQAVGILGVESVKNLVLAIQVFGNFGSSPDQKALTDQLWHHSMSVAVAAKRIMKYETGNPKLAEEAYTAGLLHDIGKLVFINAVPEAFEKARETAREREIPLWQAENELIGCNHAQAGAYILGRWAMPATLVEAVALHHEPINTLGSGFSCLSAVHAANAIIWERAPGDTINPDSRPDKAFLDEIGKGANWDEWKEVATGKRTEKPAKPAPSPGAAADRESAPRADRTPAPTATQPLQKKSKGATAAILAAACLGVVAGIFLLAKADTPQSIETAKPTPQLPTKLDDEPLAEPEVELAHAEDPDQIEPDLAAMPAAVPERAPKPEIENSELAATEQSDIETQTEIAAATEETVIAEADTVEQTLKPKLPAPEDSFPELVLSGIFYNPDKPLASLNGKIRGVGDVVAGAKIERIESKRVIVRYDGTLKALKLD